MVHEVIRKFFLATAENGDVEETSGRRPKEKSGGRWFRSRWAGRSYEEGYVAAILTEAGDSAAVGAPVALLAKTEADIAAVAVPPAASPRKKVV